MDQFTVVIIELTSRYFCINSFSFAKFLSAQFGMSAFEYESVANVFAHRFFGTSAIMIANAIHNASMFLVAQVSTSLVHGADVHVAINHFTEISQIISYAVIAGEVGNQRVETAVSLNTFFRIFGSNAGIASSLQFFNLFIGAIFSAKTCT